MRKRKKEVRVKQEVVMRVIKRTRVMRMMRKKMLLNRVIKVSLYPGLPLPKRTLVVNLVVNLPRNLVGHGLPVQREGKVNLKRKRLQKGRGQILLKIVHREDLVNQKNFPLNGSPLVIVRLPPTNVVP